ncbi:hypothetical protein AMTR_s00006p00043890 [Amborella trichopoda]|uniref:Uncharacterized protein n=1 Tax=Amborella trichopoda TaxID=13333 RepID=W1PCC8_AMBTC|nr:hypothetical protein AMTR_s00006p00043890 [Amborella trichopoda]
MDNTPKGDNPSWVRKAEDLIKKTNLFLMKFDQYMSDFLRVWEEYEHMKRGLDVVSLSVGKHKLGVQALNREVEVFEDALEELRGSVYDWCVTNNVPVILLPSCPMPPPTALHEPEDLATDTPPTSHQPREVRPPNQGTSTMSTMKQRLQAV